eukprot:2266_1
MAQSMRNLQHDPSKRDSAVPMPMVIRSSSYDMYNKDEDGTTEEPHPTQPIGGILAKYKQSNLLFKVRKSYAGGSPQAPPSPHRVTSFDDIAENEVNDHTNDPNTPIDYNVYNLSVQAPPSSRNLTAAGLTPSQSPRDERRVSEMHDFTFKPRHRVTRSTELQDNRTPPVGRARAMSDGAELHNAHNINSFSEFADQLNKARHSDIIDTRVEKKYVPHLDYIAILVSSTITWFFYHYYIAFYNWNDEIAQFNDGSPSNAWNKKYLSLTIVYVVFIWANMGFNPFYFSYFRKRNDIDINTKKGTIKICLMRFWIISFLVYCVVMTALCIANYDDYSVRLAKLTVLYVLLPGVITNVIISGYLLQRQPGIFIACHCIAWLISILIIFFVFAGYDGHSLHLTYYFMVSIIAFCAYLLTSVAIKASISIQESDLKRINSEEETPKNIVLRQGNKRVSAQSASADSDTRHIDVDLMVQYKKKPIPCCCNACEIKLELFFKIQSLLSALTFWLFWGVASISEKAEYDTITELVFVLLSCWWNPMFYSTTIRASKSIRKYIMTSYFIVGAIVGVGQCFLFILYWYIKSTYGKGTDGWVISDGGLVLHEENIRFASLFLAFVVCFIFYFPATGYLFYLRDSRLSFGLSHLFFATMAVFIPLAITDIADRNIFHIGGTEFGVKFITDEFHRDIHNKKMTVIILYMVIFAMFLSLSGFSCTYFRFKRVLVESQALVTGSIIYRNKWLKYRQEYPMTLTMFITLMMAFGDFVTDFLFAFVDLGLKPWIRVTSIGLFIIQCLLQVFSLQSVIFEVRGQLSVKKGKHQLQYFSEWLYGYIGRCGTSIVYPFCWFLYYIALLSISLMLGLSKTIAVRQVQQWWLSLIVVDYQEIAAKKLEQHIENQKKVQKQLQGIGARKLDHRYHSKRSSQQLSDDVDDYLHLYGVQDEDHLDDIHAAYWAELDKMVVKRSDGRAEEEEVDVYITTNPEDEERDPNYDPRRDDDNISMGIQRIRQKRQNIKDRTQSVESVKKKKRKKKKKKPEKRIWLGWDTGTDLGLIFKIYLFVDQYTPRWMKRLYINANVYNTYVLTELIVVSLPQCILLITNAYIQNYWTGISIASITFCGIMIIPTVAKFVYYVAYLNKNMKSVTL